MTQSELARRLGVHASYLSTIEHGSKSPANTMFLDSIAANLQLDYQDTKDLFLAAKMSQGKIHLPANLSLTAYTVAANFVAVLAELDDEELKDLESMIDVVTRSAKRTRRATSAPENVKRRESQM